MPIKWTTWKKWTNSSEGTIFQDWIRKKLKIWTACHGSWDGARARPRGATLRLRTGSCREELPCIRGKEQRLCFAGAAVKRDPTSKVREIQVKWQVLREGNWGQAHWNYNHRKLANLITQTTALSNSMKLSHAVWDHPRWMGHGGEVWHNVVHWRRGWHTTSVVLPWEPHEKYEKANDRILREELPRSVHAQYATGDQWRNNSKKNEGIEAKQKQHPAVKWDRWWMQGSML